MIKLGRAKTISLESLFANARAIGKRIFIFRQSLFGQPDIMIINKYMQWFNNGMKHTSSQTALAVMNMNKAAYC